MRKFVKPRQTVRNWMTVVQRSLVNLLRPTLPEAVEELELAREEVDNIQKDIDVLLGE